MNMMMTPDEEKRLLSDWGGPPPREINADTHVGNSVQKPYATLDPRLARKQRQSAWTSFAELKAAVEAAYPTGVSRNVRQNADGSIEHQVTRHSGNPPVGDERGVLQLEVIREWVPVAATAAAAKAASAAGVRTDYFNGWTWVIRGEKNSSDQNTMALDPSRNPRLEIAYEPASEADQLRYRAQVAASMATAGVPPVMPAGTARVRAPDSSAPSGAPISATGTSPGGLSSFSGDPFSGVSNEAPSDVEHGTEPVAASGDADPVDAKGLLTPQQRQGLAKAGFANAGDVRRATDEELMDVDSIGPAAVEKLRSQQRPTE